MFLSLGGGRFPPRERILRRACFLSSRVIRREMMIQAIETTMSRTVATESTGSSVSSANEGACAHSFSTGYLCLQMIGTR